jgi:hypothetical protein
MNSRKSGVKQFTKFHSTKRKIQEKRISSSRKDKTAKWTRKGIIKLSWNTEMRKKKDAVSIPLY